MSAANWYLDTSALLPFYRNEPATQSVQAFLSSLDTPVTISDLTGVEFASALSRLVRTDELTEAQANLVEQAFADDPGYNGFCGSISTPFIEPETNRFSNQLSA
jgi:predicted nucleic acid-binding protein